MSGTVTINGTSYTIYGTRASADQYWESSLGGTADAWDGNAAKRDKALVQARRLLDRILWIDDVDTFAERDAIEAFQFASYEIAGLLIVDSDFFTRETSGSNVKAVYAGDGVGVQFFAPTLGITGRFPVQIQELIGIYLAGLESGSVSGSYASGTSVGQTSAAGTGETAGEGLFDFNRSLD